MKMIELNRHEACRLLHSARNYQDCGSSVQEIITLCKHRLAMGNPVVLGGYQIDSAFDILTDAWCKAVRTGDKEEARHYKGLIYKVHAALN